MTVTSAILSRLLPLEASMLLFSGTAQEYQAVRHLFERAADPLATTNGNLSTCLLPRLSGLHLRLSKQRPCVSVDLVVRMLTYKPLRMPRQKGLLVTLYRAMDWISATDICRQMDTDKRALTGVIGGIGLRCKAQRGWPRRSDTGERPTRWVILHDRRGTEDWYCITPVLKEAIERANIL